MEERVCLNPSEVLCDGWFIAAIVQGSKRCHNRFRVLQYLDELRKSLLCCVILRGVSRLGQAIKAVESGICGKVGFMMIKQF